MTTADVAEYQSHLFGDGGQDDSEAFAGGDTASHGDVIGLFREATGLTDPPGCAAGGLVDRALNLLVYGVNFL